MPTSAIGSLRYPQASDGNDVPADMLRLVTDLGAVITATFATAAARDAAITSPVEGQKAYLLNVHYETIYIGGAWIQTSPTSQEALMTGGSLSLTSSLQDVAGCTLSWTTVSPNTVVIIHAVVDFQLGTVTSYPVSHAALVVNGAVQSKVVTFNEPGGGTFGDRGTQAQMWRLPFPTPGTYVTKLQAVRDNGATVVFVMPTHTNIIGTLYPGV